MIYDTIIIGAGPAGLSAGIYAARAGYNAITFEKMFPGGQVSQTDMVENYPGIKEITGMDLAMQLSDHAQSAGTTIKTEEIIKLDVTDGIKKIHTNDAVYETKTIVIATGAKPRRLNLESELRLSGKGVSYCATCDGNFFKNKDVAVIGGGDTAVEEALYLSNIVKKVYLVHRRDEFRAKQVIVDKVIKKDNIEIIWDSNLKQIQGEDSVTGIEVENKNTQQTTTHQVQGVFVAIGTLPESGFVKDLVNIDDDGYIICNCDLQTSIPGIFAAGDVRQKTLRQIVTAAADGALCVTSIERHLNEI